MQEMEFRRKCDFKVVKRNVDFDCFQPLQMAADTLHELKLSTRWRNFASLDGYREQQQNYENPFSGVNSNFTPLPSTEMHGRHTYKVKAKTSGKTKQQKNGIHDARASDSVKWHTGISATRQRLMSTRAIVSQNQIRN